MIHTPVARLPLAARVYLASITVSMLVLIALHFSIQDWSQEQARQWIGDWEKQYGGHVGEVRLHMLRGALSIRDIQWQAKTSGEGIAGIEFYAPFVLLRGNLSAPIQQIEIREVSLQGAKFVLPQKFFQQIVQQKKALERWIPWAGLLAPVRLVHGKNLDLVVREIGNKGGSTASFHAPFNIMHANFSSIPKQQQWHLSGELWGGSIDIEHQADDLRATFSALKAQEMSEYLGLSALNGKINGEGHWINKQEKQQLSGHIQWQGGKKDNDFYQNIHENTPATEGKLVFHGGGDIAGWQGDIYATAWPLQVFSALAPVFNQRVLTRAYFQGLVHVQSNKQGWEAHLQKGNIHDLDYQSQSSANWYVQQLSMKDALLLWPQRRLSIAAIDMIKGQWGVDSNEKNAVQKNVIQSSAWEIELPNIQFSGIQLGDIAKDIWWHDVQGNASLRKEMIRVKAETSSDTTGAWKLQVQGPIANKHHIMDLKLSLKLQATGVPLRYFRDALPQNLSQTASLNGDVDLQLTGIWENQGWQLQGEANGKDLMWNRGAWLWQAKQVQFNGISFASTQAPHIKDMRIKDWSGQTSLKPWSQTITTNPPSTSAAFTLDGWQLDHATIKHGQFSLGQAESVWFDDALINFKNLQQGQDVSLQLRGKLADGDFTFNGTWFPWGKHPWLTFEASLKHALPFRAAAWLKNSGLPIFNQGRISVYIKVSHADQQPQHYQGHMRLILSHGQLQGGIFSNQTLSNFTGYTAHALFDRITRNGSVRLKVPLQGNWVDKPFNSNMLGEALLTALTAKASEAADDHHKETVFSLPNIRLHDTLDGRPDKLKHNERVRLREVLHLLQADKSWRVELMPELGQAVLNESLLHRVRQTQQQIETFLVERGISPARIFPVWPEETSRQGESTGILIQAVK